MYMEAARKRNGNALKGNEYMSLFRWSWEGLCNVLIPERFFRDLEIGTGKAWRGPEATVLGWGLWALASVLMLLDRKSVV